MNSYVTGFLDSAKQNGIPEKEAMTILKAACAADPALAKEANMQPGGMQAGLGAPGPEQTGAGQPPLPQGGGEGGIPPELEELINSLPPEVLQQLLAEVEQELQGGGQGGPPPQDAGAPQGGPPQGGLPPEGMPKQGSAKEDTILAKTAEYQEGFLEASQHYGVDRNTTVQLFKQALHEMEQSPIDLSLIHI